jgi:hypothetical protein
MTNLSNLSVSLTKHGAHKISTLLKNVPAKALLTNLNGSVKNVYIDHIQAQKNLSAQSGKVPSVWSNVQALGPDAIDALTLFAIIFSHKKLITAMTESSTAPYIGTIKRNDHLSGKEFTNFSHTLTQLGFATNHNTHTVSYDINKLFDPKFGPLAAEILSHKLTTAGWQKKNTVEEEAAILKLHMALSIPEHFLRDWLTGAPPKPKKIDIGLPIEDEYFFSSASDTAAANPFKFIPGHTPKPEGSINIKTPTNKITAELLHNKIQNNLFLHLEEKYGKGSVGTEVSTGDGTSIDVVLKNGEEYWFYEIKTANSVKATIRQAIPQLLEYSYWPDTTKATRLIIVSHLPPQPITESYLSTLRTRFNIPIYYQQFCMASTTLK